MLNLLKVEVPDMDCSYCGAKKQLAEFCSICGNSLLVAADNQGALTSYVSDPVPCVLCNKSGLVRSPWNMLVTCTTCGGTGYMKV